MFTFKLKLISYWEVQRAQAGRLSMHGFTHNFLEASSTFTCIMREPR